MSSTSGGSDEIDSAFATLAHERLDALFVPASTFFVERSAQLATLAARDRIPASYPLRQMVEAGGLMSYGSDIVDVFIMSASMAAEILNGGQPGRNAGRAANEVRVRHQPESC